MDKKPIPESSRNNIYLYFLIACLVVVVIIVVLALLGPTQGVVVSNITTGLHR